MEMEGGRFCNVKDLERGKKLSLLISRDISVKCIVGTQYHNIDMSSYCPVLVSVVQNMNYFISWLI